MFQIDDDFGYLAAARHYPQLNDFKLEFLGSVNAILKFALTRFGRHQEIWACFEQYEGMALDEVSLGMGIGVGTPCVH